MNRHWVRFLSAILVIAVAELGVPRCLLAQTNLTREKYRERSSAGSTPSTILNINNITTWIQADGLFPPNFGGDWNGEFPKGSGVGVIFQEGIVFGGLVHDGQPDAVRVGGTTYPTGMVPGKILTDANGSVIGAENPNDPGVGIWRIRPDVRPGISITADLTMDASTYFMVRPNEVTPSMILQLQTKYLSDWNNWPASKGAPWYIDSVGEVRNDASFDPTNIHDIAGIPGAAQTVWFVCNDLDPGPVYSLYGSPPIGIEEQMTLWEYSNSSLLNNAYFKQVRLIYKGTTQSAPSSEIDSMYIADWRDTDVGDPGDDYSGCDSALSLGYSYNGKPVDKLYAAANLAPPAIGVAFLGSVARFTGNSSDSALINFSWRHRYAPAFTLPLTGYYAHQTGTAISDPDLGQYSGTLQFYNLLRADLPRPEYPAGVPLTSAFNYPSQHHMVTNYLLSGDPITQTGWIDGLDVSASSRRDCAYTGPFTLKLHDTAEVVVAMIGGESTDYLSCIPVVQNATRLAQDLYKVGFKTMTPAVVVKTKIADSSATVKVAVDTRGEGVSAANATLRHLDGSVLSEFPLYDDGTHGDSLAGDGFFSGSFSCPHQSDALRLDVEVSGKHGTFNWQDVADNITTNGPIVTGLETIYNDNLNQDRVANPGEIVRLTFTISNNGGVPVNNLSLYAPTEIRSEHLKVASIGPHTSYSLRYSEPDPTSYLSFQIPSSYGDSLFAIPLAIRDQSGNIWLDTLRIPVQTMKFPFNYSTIKHVSGSAGGNFTIRIINPDEIKDHIYQIAGVDSIDSIGTHGISLRDSTAGTALFENHPLPDKLGDNMPVTDGFMISSTSVDSGIGMTGWLVPSGTQCLTYIEANSFGLEGFNGAMGMGYDNWFSSSTIHPYQLHNVLLKFVSTDQNGKITDPLDTNVTMAYRYLRQANDPPADTSFIPYIANPSVGYAYQDRRPVPIAAYDLEQNNRRLDIGFLENNSVGGRVDGKYWPPLSSDGIDNSATTREWLFVFGTNYSSSSDNAALKIDILDNTPPMMWLITANRLKTAFSDSDSFEILAFHPLTSSDLWSFNPLNLSGGKPPLPISYKMEQNYPNPFNPRTSIQFSIPKAGHVTMKIYNILGQEIATILDNDLQRGTYTYLWDGRNSSGEYVASGVYFCRIVASGNSFVKKMMLVK